MKKFALPKLDIEGVKDLHYQEPSAEHCPNLVSEPGIYTFEGKPVIIMGKLAGEQEDLLWALNSMTYQPESRTVGGAYRRRKKVIIGESRVLGFQPRVGISQNFCRLASLAKDHPKQHSTLIRLGQSLAAEYQKSAPTTYVQQIQSVREKVHKDWIIPGTPFTSGIANKNNNLKYHFDGNNIEGVFSCMLVLQSGCTGGELCVPATGTRFKIPSMHYIMFDGHGLLHGVTQISRSSRHAYRYSVVYYSLKKMCECMSLGKELERLQELKTVAQRNRAEASLARKRELDAT